jgi:hypothetical protein
MEYTYLIQKNFMRKEQRACFSKLDTKRIWVVGDVILERFANALIRECADIAMRKDHDARAIQMADLEQTYKDMK